MSFETILSDFTNSVKKFKDTIYEKITIKPKYIVFCNGNKKKTVYQSDPKEVKVKINMNEYYDDENSDTNEKEVLHKTYIQNSINISDDIENYTHAILVDENDKEYIIDKEFLVKNMFNNIHNTTDKEYVLTIIAGVPIKIEESFEKSEERYQEVTYDKKKIAVGGGILALMTLGLVRKVF